MKKFKQLTIIFICIIFLYSCDTTPIIDGEKPFIVNQIDMVNDEMCEYYGNRDASWDGNGFSGRPSIVLSKGLYNIGDTIRWKK